MSMLTHDWQPHNELPGYEQRLNASGHLEVRPCVPSVVTSSLQDNINHPPQLQRNARGDGAALPTLRGAVGGWHVPRVSHEARAAMVV